MNLQGWLVVPYVGTWIEIYQDYDIKLLSNDVVPYVGTWIEMQSERIGIARYWSFPTWERG